jgi:hypothetical protein
MTRHFASALSFAASTAAIACAAAMASSSAYAESPLAVPATPFVSSLSRAEVQAELMSQRATITAAGGEWAQQSNQVARMNSGYTTAQAKAEYLAARREVMALTGEDSGSSYLAKRPAFDTGIVVAGQAR